MINEEVLYDFVKKLPDDVIEKLRKYLAKEVECRAKKRVAKYIITLKTGSNIPDSNIFNIDDIIASTIPLPSIGCDYEIHPINPKVTKKE